MAKEPAGAFHDERPGLDAHRGVSEVVMRAATLLVVIAGVGYRRTAWLLRQLFHIDLEIGPASLGRRDRLPLPSRQEISKLSIPADFR